MGDRAPMNRFSLGAQGIHVYPLPIVRDQPKPVYGLLIDDDGAGNDGRLTLHIQE